MKNMSNRNEEENILNQEKERHPNDFSITYQIPQIRNEEQPNQKINQEELEKLSNKDDQVRKNRPENNENNRHSE